MQPVFDNSSETTHFNPAAFKLRSRAALEGLERVFGSDRAAEPKSVLDYGCGNGMMSQLLEAAGFDVTATDIGAQQLERARARLKNAKLVQGHVNDVEFEYGAFDAIVSLEVLEHLYDPELYMTRAYKFLKPGGTLILSTPYYGYVKNLALSLRGDWDKHFMVDELHGHIKLFSKKKLIELCGKTGFQVEDWRPLGRLAPLAMMQMIIARKTN